MTAPEPLFRHEALFYRDPAGYLEGVVPFVRSGLAAEETVVVAVPPPDGELIRAALGPQSRRVRFLDMARIGRNPGRIIPTFLVAFADTRPEAGVRLVGEPIWPGRSAGEYPACVQHEALINLAFAGRRFAAVCPYDAARLDPAVLTDAGTTHPVIVEAGDRRASPSYTDPATVVGAFDRPPLEAPATAVRLRVHANALGVARRTVAAHASAAGLEPARAADLALAVNEIVTNSLLHAGTAATLSIWCEDGSRDNASIVCQVEDSGELTDLLAGRIPPARDATGGHGLVLVNHLCDLVRICRVSDGLTIRLQMNL